MVKVRKRATEQGQPHWSENSANVDTLGGGWLWIALEQGDYGRYDVTAFESMEREGGWVYRSLANGMIYAWYDREVEPVDEAG